MSQPHASIPSVRLLILQLFRSRVYSKIASLNAILISAVYHEYVLWAPLRFVLPVLLLFYSTFGGESVQPEFVCMSRLSPPIPNSCHVFRQAFQRQSSLELLYTHRHPCGCVDERVCLCNGVHSSLHMLSRREHCQHLHTSVLRMLYPGIISHQCQSYPALRPSVTAILCVFIQGTFINL